MALDRKAFDALVARYEAMEKSGPRAYRARVLAFALLGYAYIAFVVVLLAGMLALCAASVVYLKFLGVKLLLILGPMTWIVFKSLWVTLNAPKGIEVTRKQAPELFARLDRLRKSMHAQRFHRVIVNDEFNAGVVQVPRLGVFGWHRNYLLLGVPLLKSLTPEQLDAVIAHEFGQQVTGKAGIESSWLGLRAPGLIFTRPIALAIGARCRPAPSARIPSPSHFRFLLHRSLVGGHAAFHNWLYRLRSTWTRLMEDLAWAGNQGAWMFRSCFEWYVPRFNACTFPLARSDEYEADAMAARLT